MPTYRLDILITGRDRASPRVQGFGRALRRVGQIAAGILIAGTIRAITDQIFGLGRTAFDAIAQLQLMEVGLQSLIGRELARGNVIETSVLRELSLSEAQILTLDKLIVKRAKLTEELEEATTAYNDLTESEELGSIATLEASIAMRELQGELDTTTTKIGNLQSQASGTVTVFEKVRQGQMSLRDALRLAQEPAKQLTKWVTKLALISPYEEKDILNVMRVAAGYGFITQYGGDAITETERLKLAQDDGVVTAQRLTVALLDLIAAIGLPAENLGRITLALGQVRAHGKLLAQEIRQMINAGVGLDIMALAMGMTVDEFMNAQKAGNILAEDFLPKLVELLEKDLAGAAERVSRTLLGLQANFTELKRVMLREFFLPLVEYMIPTLLELYDNLSSEENLAKVRGWGETFRNEVIGVWDWFKTLHGAIGRTKAFFANPWELIIAVSPDDWDQKLKKQMFDAITGVGGVLGALGDINPPGENLGFEEPENVAGGVLTALGALAGARVLAKAIPAIIGAIGSTLGWVAAALGIVGVAVGIAGGLWYGNFLGIRDITDDAWKTYIKPAFDDILKWFEEDVGPALTTFYDVWKEKVWDLWVDTKGFVDTDLIPSLIDVRDWLGIKIGQATVWASLKLQNNLIPRLIDLRDELKDETIPQIEGFVNKMKIDIPRAIQSWVAPWREATRNALPEFARVYNKDVQPVWGKFVTGLKNVSTIAVGEFARGVRQGITDTFGLLAQGLKEDVVPLVDRFILKVNRISTQVAVRFQDAFHNYFLPGLSSMAGWYEEHLLPAVQSFWDLLESVFGVARRLFGGFWRNIVLKALSDAWSTVFEDLNPAFEAFFGWLTEIEAMLAVPLRESLQPYIDFLFPKFATVIGWVEKALDGAKTAFDELKALLDGWELPDWALDHSPIPIVNVFDETARAINEADKAFRRNALFRGGGVNITSPLMAPAYAGVQQMGPVVFEGDENTFIVDSEATARFVTHQLREQKIKKFNEYMGR